MAIGGARSNDPAAVIVEGQPQNAGRRQSGGGLGGFFGRLFGG